MTDTRCFVATVFFRTPSILHDLMTLDAILLGELALEHGDEEAMRRLPLRTTDGVPHASCGFMEGTRWRVPFAMIVGRRNEAINSPDEINVAGVTAAARENLMVGYEARAHEVVRFAACGDAAAVEDVLMQAGAIGKLRSSGYGSIRSVEISEIEADAWTFGLMGINKAPLRPVPLPLWEMLDGAPAELVQHVRARPFYWNPDNEPEPCAVPRHHSTEYLTQAVA